MATVSARHTHTDTAAGTSYTTGSFTPTGSELMVVFCTAAASVASNTTLTASANGLTFTRYEWLSDAGVDRCAIFVANQLLGASPSAMTLTWDITGDASTGITMSVLGISGMSKTGATAVKQSAIVDNNQGAGATPTVTFGAACTTTNPVVGFVSNNSAANTLTAPTNYTEIVDISGASPTSGNHVSKRDSGETGTTITWGSTSTRGSVAAIEFDASSSGTAHTVDASDSAQLVDSATLSVGHAKSNTDLAGLADSAQVSQGHTRSATDALGLSDSAQISFARAVDTSDAAGLSDSVDIQVGFNTEDSTGLGDSATVSQGHTSSPTDLAGLSDSASSSLQMATATTDQLGLSDNAVVSLYRSIPIDATDSVQLGDAALLSMEHVVAVKDSLPLSDTATVRQDHARSTADSVGLADSAVVSRGLGVQPSDPLGLSDVVAIALGHNHAVFDTLGLSDSAQVQLSATMAVNLQSSMGLSDNATVILFSLLTHDVSDALGLSDSAVLSMARGLPVADSAGLLDAFAIAMQHGMVASDDTGLLDSVIIAQTHNFFAPGGDLMALSDAAQVILLAPLGISVSEPVGLGDSATVELFLPYIPASNAEADFVDMRTSSASVRAGMPNAAWPEKTASGSLGAGSTGTIE